MSLLEIFALALIVIGAVINFLVPQIIKKNSDFNNNLNTIYIVKSIGLVLVVIGCIIFFWLGGKFSV
ncbi:MAG: hypothetical protein IJB50_03705 [Clostridia bacterium]|nr:hypothetical protein [Clostridia bacterium]